MSSYSRPIMRLTGQKNSPSSDASIWPDPQPRDNIVSGPPLRSASLAICSRLAYSAQWPLASKARPDTSLLTYAAIPGALIQSIFDRASFHSSDNVNRVAVILSVFVISTVLFHPGSVTIMVCAPHREAETAKDPFVRRMECRQTGRHAEQDSSIVNRDQLAMLHSDGAGTYV